MSRHGRAVALRALLVLGPGRERCGECAGTSGGRRGTRKWAAVTVAAVPLVGGGGAGKVFGEMAARTKFSKFSNLKPGLCWW